MGWCSDGCYEDRIATCDIKGRLFNFIRAFVKPSKEIIFTTTSRHRVHIPSSALQRSKGAASEQEEIMLLSTVINSTYFKNGRRRVAQLTPLIYSTYPIHGVGPPQRKGRTLIPTESAHSQPTVLGGLVLLLKAGNHPVANLSQPIELTFTHSELVGSGTCVFWQEQDEAAGYWSTEGCSTHQNGTEFICSCNHLSFFAVLVNPLSTVDETNANILSYITYIGSALSVTFTVISLIIYVFLQRQRPEKAIALHMQLTVALFCLHLSFLLGSFWVRLLKKNEVDLVCKLMGFSLHWSLLATLTWTALEGFHLYLLLVRVFNIYVTRYLLKLSLVGWGLPTVIATVCGISGVYGKFTLRDSDKKNATAEICWMSSDFKHHLLVIYISVLAYSCLVILCNSCMLGVVVFRMWAIRGGCGRTESNSGWKRMTKENGSRLWKDCATVLGLSCVLGLPWGLATTTFTSLTAIYIFTILNSLQGFIMFLWSLALTCKSRSDNNSSIRDPSSQKMMTTSFNN